MIIYIGPMIIFSITWLYIGNIIFVSISNVDEKPPQFTARLLRSRFADFTCRSANVQNGQETV